jgi:hypothetical protein
VGITGEEWNIFCRRWEVFTTGSGIDEDSASLQLFQYAEDALGDSLLRMDPGITTNTVKEVLQVMQSLAVIPVATGVLRADLLQVRQERAEAFREYAARVRGKAETSLLQQNVTAESLLTTQTMLFEMSSSAALKTKTLRRSWEQPTSWKDIVHTLQSRFGDSVRPFLNDEGVLPAISHKHTLNALHTALQTVAVRASKAKLVNKLLHRPARNSSVRKHTSSSHSNNSGPNSFNIL